MEGNKKMNEKQFERIHFNMTTKQKIVFEIFMCGDPEKLFKSPKLEMYCEWVGISVIGTPRERFFRLLDWWNGKRWG